MSRFLLMLALSFSIYAAEEVRIVCVGDSITANNAIGTLGCYPVALSHYLAIAGHPEKRVINSGVSGNTSSQIKFRFESSVLVHNPDVIVILCGINDCYRHGINDPDVNLNVSPEQYRANLQQMITLARGQNPSVQIVLASPFLICRQFSEIVQPNFTITHWNLLPNYILAAKETAQNNSVLYLPLHDRFQASLTGIPAIPAAYYCDHPYYADSVHPGEKGNLFIARAITKILGYD